MKLWKFSFWPKKSIQSMTMSAFLVYLRPAQPMSP